MTLRRPLPDRLVRVLAALILAGTCIAALAQADPPGRVARLGNAEGPVIYSSARDDEWTNAELNRPLVRGDRLWTDKGSRADVQVGSAAVRMDGQTHLQFVVVDDQNAQFRVTMGSVLVRVRLLPEGENFEVDTPHLAFRAAQPGDYRLDVDPQWGTTRVTILSGKGAVYGEGGQSMSLGGGQQITYRGRGLAKVDVRESPSQDNFDRWAAERNRREDQSVAARYVPRDVVGYQSLDAAGRWSHDTTYGAVWLPEFTPANWAPFRNGRWEWIAPWGWTWIDDAPWGFACSHYGRWAMIGNRWAWVPGRMGPRPIFAPALVAFVGRPDRWSVPLGGKPAVAWFPLAPGEPWQPGFSATPLYKSDVNYNMSPAPAGDAYAFKSKTAALTVITADDFNRGKPVVGSWFRVAGNVLTQAQIVSAPPMPAHPHMPARPPEQLVARAAPAADIRTVASVQPPVTPPAAAEGAQQAPREQQLAHVAQARAAEKAQAEKAQAEKAQGEKAQAEKVQAEKARQQVASQVERARAAEQARAAEDARQAQATAKAAHAAARQAERARAAEQSRQAEAAKKARQEAARAQAAQQAKVAEQSRRAEQKSREAQARSAAEAKREQAARSEKAKREQAAATQRERQRRQQAAHAKAQREDQARRAVAAKKDKEDQARRATAHAQQVELAQRAADHHAQALREQRQRREEAVRRQAEDDARRETSQRRWQRPVLPTTPTAQPEFWQRGTPIFPPGRTS